jgi:protoheme IX farnesyltransferase
MTSALPIKSYIKIIADLSKVKITIMVAMTTLTGYILAKRQMDFQGILPAIGIFLLGSGSSALNHLQEKRTDAFMFRTQNRPLPAGIISTKFALGLIAIEVLSGSWLLLLSSGLQAFLLGAIALIWYNGIYTLLKKITVNAVIPGSVIGAIPPLVGWVAGNGSLLSPYAWIIAGFFFIWQVPHFYLLAYKYADQYKNAGFPSIKDRYTEKTFKIMIYIWSLAMSVATIFLQLAGILNSAPSSVLLVIAIVWLVITFAGLLIKPQTVFKPGKYFMEINFFVLFVIIILSIDHLLL